MMIHPAAFTLEHIPKTLSPTGNISSAPKDFAVYVSARGCLSSSHTFLGVPTDESK